MLKRQSGHLGRIHDTGLHKVFINTGFGVESKTPCSVPIALNHQGALKTGIVGNLVHRFFEGTLNEVHAKLLFIRESSDFKYLHGTFVSDTAPRNNTRLYSGARSVEGILDAVLSFISVSFAAPTLVTATPPLNFASRPCNRSLS